MHAQSVIDKTGVRNKYIWTQELEDQYLEKRRILAEMGFVTDSQVCQWFARNGINDVPEHSIKQVFYTALDKKPVQIIIDALTS